MLLIVLNKQNYGINYTNIIHQRNVTMFFFVCFSFVIVVVVAINNKTIIKIISWNNYTHLQPVKMLSNVLFPAPEGPIIAVSSPDLKWPLTFLRMSFSSESREEGKNYHFPSILIVYIFFSAIVLTTLMPYTNILSRVYVVYHVDDFFFS